MSYLYLCDFLPDDWLSYNQPKLMLSLDLCGLSTKEMLSTKLIYTADKTQVCTNSSYTKFFTFRVLILWHTHSHGDIGCYTRRHKEMFEQHGLFSRSFAVIQKFERPLR